MFLFVPQMAGGGMLIAFLLRVTLTERPWIAVSIGALVPPVLLFAPLLWEDDTAPALTWEMAADLVSIATIGCLIAAAGAACGTLIAKAALSRRS